ncbi:ABC transporter C family member 12-like [Cicer arietinum]|uniref:ABC transporter C family member 12-like n=1 Tax=Cicer arietinum TaxID=3827 RepID=UPI003CC6C23D
MGFEPLIWYCKPEPNSIWDKIVDSTFGSYTPCAINTLVNSTSNLVLMGLCLYRIWLISCNVKAQRFCLKSNYYNYMLGMLACYCAFQPVLRLLTGNSVFNLNEETGFAPFEITALVIESLTWISMIILILLETKVYIRQFSWLVRFGVIYVLVGDIVMLDLLLSVKDYSNRSALFLYISTVIFQVLFGTLLLVYIPNLVQYSHHTTIQAEIPENGEYEPLCGDDQVFPEMRANLLSSE